MKGRLRVSLKNGAVLLSKPDDVSDEEAKTLRTFVEDVAGGGGEYISFTTDDGWSVVPWAEVLYVEFQRP